LLDKLQATKCQIVTSQQLVELIDMSHVVLFLQSDVDDGLWDWFSYSFQELGFSDDDL
jgi:hypothetical protein